MRPTNSKEVETGAKFFSISFYYYFLSCCLIYFDLEIGNCWWSISAIGRIIFIIIIIIVIWIGTSSVSVSVSIYTQTSLQNGETTLSQSFLIIFCCWFVVLVLVQSFDDSMETSTVRDDVREPPICNSTIGGHDQHVVQEDEDSSTALERDPSRSCCTLALGERLSFEDEVEIDVQKVAELLVLPRGEEQRPRDALRQIRREQPTHWNSDWEIPHRFHSPLSANSRSHPHSQIQMITRRKWNLMKPMTKIEIQSIPSLMLVAQISNHVADHF